MAAQHPIEAKRATSNAALILWTTVSRQVAVQIITVGNTTAGSHHLASSTVQGTMEMADPTVVVTPGTILMTTLVEGAGRTRDQVVDFSKAPLEVLQVEGETWVHCGVVGCVGCGYDVCGQIL